MAANAHLSIRELASAYDVSLRTLRFYEELELLTPVRSGNTRYYTEKDCVRLQLIIKAKRFGFSLYQIWRLIAAAKNTDEHNDVSAMMSRNEIRRQISSLEGKRAAISDAIAELEAALDAGKK